MNPFFIKVSLGYFFIVAFLGTVLRAIYWIELPFEYTHLVHAHSHVAFQGWIYTLMILLLPSLFLQQEVIARGRYKLQFILTAILLLGILISFSLQGYGLFSIIFSTLFQGFNYWFIFRFLTDLKRSTYKQESSLSLSWIRTGLYLGLLSTLLPIGIGISSAKGYAGTELHSALIYTFLHLQYNGWFLFVGLGLLLRFLELKGVHLNQKLAFWSFRLFAIAVLPAIVLSFLGMSFKGQILWIGVFSAGLQFIAMIFLLASIPKNIASKLYSGKNWSGIYLSLFLVSFTLKVGLQSLSVIPALSDFIFFSKPILLGYLHLSFIGVLSFLFLGILCDLAWIRKTRLSSLGHFSLIAGFIVTEGLLFADGLGLLTAPTLLTLGSAAMAIGLMALLLGKFSAPTAH